MGAIVPGKLRESALIEHIFSDDPKLVMPPAKTLKKLTAAQKETLKRWIVDTARRFYQDRSREFPPALRTRTMPISCTTRSPPLTMR